MNICEQARQQPKEDLGQDHCWTRHQCQTLMTMIALCLSQNLRLSEGERQGRPPRPIPPIAQCRLAKVLHHIWTCCPHLRQRPWRPPTGWTAKVGSAERKVPSMSLSNGSHLGPLPLIELLDGLVIRGFDGHVQEHRSWADHGCQPV